MTVDNQAAPGLPTTRFLHGMCSRHLVVGKLEVLRISLRDIDSKMINARCHSLCSVLSKLYVCFLVVSCGLFHKRVCCDTGPTLHPELVESFTFVVKPVYATPAASGFFHNSLDLLNMAAYLPVVKKHFCTPFCHVRI